MITDRHWAMLKDSMKKFNLITCSNIYRSTYNLNCCHGFFFEVAVSVSSSVGIVLFSSNATIISKVFKSVRRKTSTTAMIVIVTSAVYQLLFTQVLELVILDHVV